MTVQDLILQTEDLKQNIARNFDESLSSRAEEVRKEAERETIGKLNRDIEKLASFKIIMGKDDPILANLSHKTGVAESHLSQNQAQAGQIVRLLEYFKMNPDGPCPELKTEPVVGVDIIRLVAKCAAIADKFETAKPQLMAEMLRGVAI